MKMTIFYRKRNLQIVAAGQGEQTLRYFGEDIEDNSLIYDLLVLDYDEFVMNNCDYFHLERKEDGSVELVINDELKEKMKEFL